MTQNNEEHRKRQEPASSPDDELDALLRDWHRENAARAAAGRDRLLRILAEHPRQPLRAEESASSLSSLRSMGHDLATRRFARIAASIVFVMGLVAVLLIPGWPFKDRGTALAFDLREVGFVPPLAAAGLWPDLDDEAAMRQAELAVAENRAALEWALSEGNDDVAAPWIPWTKLYRNLWSLGRWEQAHDELRKFLAYAEQRDRSPERYTMYYTGLYDLGNYYAALGDYETATVHFRESLRLRHEYHEWWHDSGRADDPRPHALESVLATGLSPCLWRLSTLAAAQGHQQEAWDHHRQAGELLADYLRKECAHRELGAPGGASLFELGVLVASVAEEVVDSAIVHVRQHLLHEATLTRLDRDPEAAAEILEQVRSLPDYVWADDYRQDFHVPMEELRIAIARGDFAAALAAADEAAQHTGPRYGFARNAFHPNARPEAPPVDQPPIGPLARAELRFLRGVGLTGLDPADPEALCWIQSALDALHHAAASLPERLGETLLRRFETWECLAEQIGTRESQRTGTTPYIQ